MYDILTCNKQFKYFYVHISTYTAIKLGFLVNKHNSTNFSLLHENKLAIVYELQIIAQGEQPPVSIFK